MSKGIRDIVRRLTALAALWHLSARERHPFEDAPNPTRRVLRFEVKADTFAAYREAMLLLRRSAGGRLDDDALRLALARHVLGGPRDE